ncbi:TetR family transcriptional regulator [Saccharomonospora xinjiangensis]|uniref:TetR/AcrR family transcriptional regulator n=1 Tax=Saccharomonospora xinjiangensis TaxID=75294 RepID=UPI00106F90B0|nr:TetR family transcriptional regulator [Saccharomonospora xinjiangensis]QBQ58578.1 transcriptional regulator BetI [Saccharomonospora xinjiangensis]
MGRQAAKRTSPPGTDGRRARGERRKAEIIDATLRVVERDGADGVTHRSVAREADVPPGLLTYYFASLEELLVAALSAVADEYVAQLEEIAASADPLTGFAELIASTGTTGRCRAVAERELSTLAARRPALRPKARYWREAVNGIGLRYTSDPMHVEALVAAADGLCAAILLEYADPDPEHIRAVLARALGVSPADD